LTTRTFSSPWRRLSGSGIPKHLICYLIDRRKPLSRYLTAGFSASLRRSVHIALIRTSTLPSPGTQPQASTLLSRLPSAAPAVPRIHAPRFSAHHPLLLPSSLPRQALQAYFRARLLILFLSPTGSLGCVGERVGNWRFILCYGRANGN
jgi:hypothetical protein